MESVQLSDNFEQDKIDSKVSFGIDVVEVSRIEKVISRTKSFCVKVYRDSEIAYCNSHAKPVIHYATHYAAKEAVAKTLGLGFGDGLRPYDIEVLHNKKGKPYVVLHGSSLEVFKKLSLKEIPISLTYTHKEAVGCAIALAKNQADRSVEKYGTNDITTELSRHFKEVKKIIDDQSG